MTYPTNSTTEPGLPFVDVVREFDAAAEALFRAHTDPHVFAQWTGPLINLSLAFRNSAWASTRPVLLWTYALWLITLAWTAIKVHSSAASRPE